MFSNQSLDVTLSGLNEVLPHFDLPMSELKIREEWGATLRLKVIQTSMVERAPHKVAKQYLETVFVEHIPTWLLLSGAKNIERLTGAYTLNHEAGYKFVFAGNSLFPSVLTLIERYGMLYLQDIKRTILKAWTIQDFIDKEMPDWFLFRPEIGGRLQAAMAYRPEWHEFIRELLGEMKQGITPYTFFQVKQLLDGGHISSLEYGPLTPRYGANDYQLAIIAHYAHRALSPNRDEEKWMPGRKDYSWWSTYYNRDLAFLQPYMEAQGVKTAKRWGEW